MSAGHSIPNPNELGITSLDASAPDYLNQLMKMLDSNGNTINSSSSLGLNNDSVNLDPSMWGFDRTSLQKSPPQSSQQGQPSVPAVPSAPAVPGSQSVISDELIQSLLNGTQGKHIPGSSSVVQHDFTSSALDQSSKDAARTSSPIGDLVDEADIDDEVDEGDASEEGKSGEGKPNRARSLMKRRQQNRNAQRAFRERRQKHLKDLESRLSELEANLRANDVEKARMEELITLLREENERLRESHVGPEKSLRKGHHASTTAPYPSMNVAHAARQHIMNQQQQPPSGSSSIPTSASNAQSASYIPSQINTSSTSLFNNNNNSNNNSNNNNTSGTGNNNKLSSPSQNNDPHMVASPSLTESSGISSISTDFLRSNSGSGLSPPEMSNSKFGLFKQQPENNASNSDSIPYFDEPPREPKERINWDNDDNTPPEEINLPKYCWNRKESSPFTFDLDLLCEEMKARATCTEKAKRALLASISEDVYDS